MAPDLDSISPQPPSISNAPEAPALQSESYLRDNCSPTVGRLGVDLIACRRLQATGQTLALAPAPTCISP